MKTVLFFGDSNTYGYDPRGFIGGRYPASVRWTERLAKGLEKQWIIISCGQNGRCIPDIPGDQYYLESMLQKAGTLELFACMLGTNDIWMARKPDAGTAESRMDVFLSWMKSMKTVREILLIAPPSAEAVEVGAVSFVAETKRLPELYEHLAQKHDVRFINADCWCIPKSYDGVHFSKEGHRIFAERMYEYLYKEFQI